MDVVTVAGVIAVALGSGIVHGLGQGATEVGKKAVVDAYDALISTLKKKYGDNSEISKTVDDLESESPSESSKETLAELLAQECAADDPHLKQLAQTLLEALNNTPEGNKALAKYNINLSNSRVGIIGDNAIIDSLHFGKGD